MNAIERLERLGARTALVDGGVLFVLLAATAALILRSGAIAAPAEDAAMLMRYAVNFAQGHGIAYNPSGPPVDGATDLMAVPLSGSLVWFGLSPDTSFLVLNSVSVTAIVILLYGYARIRCAWPPWWAGALVAVVLSSGIPTYLRTGFLAPVFGLIALVSWVLVEETRRRPEGRTRWALAIVLLIIPLVRPEGLAVSAVALISLWISLPQVAHRRLVVLLTAVILGAVALVAAHWAYFGHPLPNPVYVKGGGSLHFFGLVYSSAWTFMLAGPALIILAAGMWYEPSRRLALAQALPVTALTAMWVFLSNATNFSERFQFAGSMVAYMGAIVVYPKLPPSWSTPSTALLKRYRRTATIAATILLLMFTSQLVRAAPDLSHPKPSIRAAIGRSLEPFDGPDRTVVTTEAGLIPLRSGWRAVDAYGLNDPQIAHVPVITADRLAEEDPDLIILHGLGGDGRWGKTTAQLSSFALNSGYELAFPKDPADYELGYSWFIYVRKDAPDSDALAAAIQGAAAEVRRLGGDGSY